MKLNLIKNFGIMKVQANLLLGIKIRAMNYSLFFLVCLRENSSCVIGGMRKLKPSYTFTQKYSL